MKYSIRFGSSSIALLILKHWKSFRNKYSILFMKEKLYVKYFTISAQ